MNLADIYTRIDEHGKIVADAPGLKTKDFLVKQSTWKQIFKKKSAPLTQ